jgi:hypothetical protein
VKGRRASGMSDIRKLCNGAITTAVMIADLSWSQFHGAGDAHNGSTHHLLGLSLVEGFDGSNRVIVHWVLVCPLATCY